jgi:FMN phosphatase YigB (HAD superfamily)
MMDKLGVTADEICFVDDTLENIAGANNVGIIHTIHVAKTSNTLSLIESMLNTNT